MLSNHLTHSEVLKLVGSAITEPESFDRFDGESIVHMMEECESSELDLDFSEKNELTDALKHFYS